MGTTTRVASGSLTRGSSAIIIYPDEYSGSNTLKKYDQGVYVNDMDGTFGTTILKLRPNNDFHKIIDGKTWTGGLRPYDDQNAPSSFAFDLYQGRPSKKVMIDGKPQPASSGSGTNSKPTAAEMADSDWHEGWNHHWWYMGKSQIAISPGDGSTLSVTGSNHAEAKKGSGLTIAPSHFRLDYDFGQTDIFQDATPFKDTANNDPTNIVTTDPLVIDFPSNLVCQSDINLMDGVMEPFPLRSVIDHSTLEVPFQSRGIWAGFGGEDAFRRSTLIEYQVQSISSRTVTRDGRDFIKGCDPYLDGVEVFGLDLLDNFGSVTGSLEYNYAKAMTEMASGSNAEGPVYKEWWDKYKIKDLYNSDENKRSGPLMMPGYLYKPSATIPPFRDGTDREDVTANIKDESLTPDGTFGLLNFTFTTDGGKYKLCPVTSSLGLTDRPADFVLHARLDGDGNFGDNPSLKSSTNIPSTFIMYQTGTLWNFSANNIDSSPFISDLDARSLIPSLTTNSMTSGSLSPSAIVITSSHYALNEKGAETVGASTGSVNAGTTLYHSPFSPTVPGTRIAEAGTGGNSQVDYGSARGFAHGSRFFSGSTGGYMGLGRPTVAFITGGVDTPTVTKPTPDTNGHYLQYRQSVSAGWANAPTRPWAFGVWVRGDGASNYRIGTKTSADWANPSIDGDWNNQPNGPGLSTYGDHAHIYLHSSYAQQRFQVPNHSLTSSAVTSGTMHPDYNFLGSSKHKQSQFLIEYVKEYNYANVYILSFMYNSLGNLESWVNKRYYCGDSQNSHAYSAILDGKWHHWAYAQHPNAGRNIYEHLTESASNKNADSGADLTDGSAVSGSIWSNSSGSVGGEASQTWNDQDFNGFRAFVDGIPLTNGYMQGWKSAAKSSGDKRDGKLWRCPTPTSDNATLTSNGFVKHQIDFVGSLGHSADSASRRLYPMAEPTFFVTQVTSTSGSVNRDAGDGGVFGGQGSADVSGSYTDGGIRAPQTNGLPSTAWWIDNVWSGKTFKGIVGLQTIKSLSSVSGETMKNALHDMNVPVPGHYTLDRDCVSPGRGIVYDNTEYGIDSLCFGGLKK